MKFVSSLSSLFDKEGLLTKNLPGFEVREGQIGMLCDVIEAYNKESVALIEAGTGIGKSLAYLLAALAWAFDTKEKTIIATHTITLQEQLMRKDIPFLLKTLGLELKVVLLRGMQNYLCLKKVEMVPLSRQRLLQLHEGVRFELPEISQFDWEKLHADSESCTHVKCPHYRECFFFKARKEALDAHVIVANHHLLFADILKREEKEDYRSAAIFPSFRRLIIDEAHHLEKVALEYFAKRASQKKIYLELAKIIRDKKGKCQELLQKFSQQFPDDPYLFSFELSINAERHHLDGILSSFFSALEHWVGQGIENEERIRFRASDLEHLMWKEKIQPLAKSILETGNGFIAAVDQFLQKLNQFDHPQLLLSADLLISEIQATLARLTCEFQLIYEFVFTSFGLDQVRWIEKQNGLELVIADLESSQRLSKTIFEKIPTTVLCSATLTTDQKFNFLKKQLGIQKGIERIYESPFDFMKAAVFAIPSDMPDPAHPQFLQATLDWIESMVQISKGGVFVLFTSYLMMQQCARALEGTLKEKKYALFCQGDAPRSLILEQFKTTKRALLFGTDSFWEGVDVAGEALRSVIIVKLPFKVPNDPIYEAKSEKIRHEGGSPFMEYALPDAIMKFKQGFGRLIRHQNDWGSVLCLDVRLIKKGYGKKFLKSIPKCPVLIENSDLLKIKLREFYTDSAIFHRTDSAETCDFSRGRKR